MAHPIALKTANVPSHTTVLQPHKNWIYPWLLCYAFVPPFGRIAIIKFEVALPYRGNAYRVVYAVQLGDDLWVLHAFQKKSTSGIKTPKHEIDLAKDRLKRLKAMLK